jgi:uncharacterized repeat protein (TIGR03803 family)
VFELTSANGVWTETILHKFSGPGTRGPFGPLVFDRAGHLFGTTVGGGAVGRGTVFELSQTPGGAWIERDVYSFAGGDDGALPFAGLTIGTDGNLYGTTIEGGGNGCARSGFVGCGTVFRLTPPTTQGGAWMETVLHRFHGDDGREPYAGVTIDRLGNLFGTTIDGGDFAGASPNKSDHARRPFLPLPTGADGTVYEISPPKHPGGRWLETVLHSFGQTNDGLNPYGGIVFDGAGDLFGTTAFGGLAGCFFVNATCGTVFEVSPCAHGAWTESVIYLFPPGARQGAAPYGSLAFDGAGDLFGTTQLGGIQNSKHVYGTGTVFELMPLGGSWVQNILYEFPDGRDGADPAAGVIFDARGDLIVTASFGATSGVGGVLELSR